MAELAEKNGLAARRMDEDDDDERVMLVCEPCAGQRGLLAGKNQAGVFSGQQPLPNLRKAVDTHIRSRAHRRCLDNAEAEKAQEKRRHNAGMNVGRAVYYGITEAASYLAFERLLLLLHVCGVFIGTLNHSRKFAATYVTDLHAAMSARLKKWLNEPQAVTGGRKRTVAF